MHLGALCRKGLMAATLSFACSGIASATVYYQDGFSRTGILDASTPDVTTTNGNQWQQTYGDFGSGTSTYTVNGTAVGQTNTGGSPVDGSSYLPVNGTSGVLLTGLVDFTLSATITNTGNQLMGIALNTAVQTGGNMFNGGPNNPGIFTIVGFQGPNATAADNVNRDGGGNGTIGFFASPGAVPTNVSLAYSASAGTISFIIGTTTVATKTGVTPANIAALTYVSIDNGSFGNNPGALLDNFTLSDATALPAVPEPSNYAMMLIGLGGLMLVLRRHPRRS